VFPAAPSRAHCRDTPSRPRPGSGTQALYRSYTPRARWTGRCSLDHRRDTAPEVARSGHQADRRRGRFLLTGSSNVFNTLEATDSLAGRMLTLKLWPLSLAELERRGPSRLLDWAAGGAPTLADAPEAPAWPRSRYVDLILRGGCPEIRTLSPRFRGNRYRDYIDAVVDRDVSDVLRVRKSDALRRLIDQTGRPYLLRAEPDGALLERRREAPDARSVPRRADAPVTGDPPTGLDVQRIQARSAWARSGPARNPCRRADRDRDQGSVGGEHSRLPSPEVVRHAGAWQGATSNVDRPVSRRGKTCRSGAGRSHCRHPLSSVPNPANPRGLSMASERCRPSRGHRRARPKRGLRRSTPVSR